MELEIRQYYSSDVDNLRTWAPSKLEDIYFPLEMKIGIKGGAASDLFQVLVATPEAIRKHCRQKGPVLAERGIMVVDQFNWQAIQNYLIGIVKHCSVETWDKSVIRLQRYFKWEYEDYKIV